MNARLSSAGIISISQFLDCFRRAWVDSRVSGIRGCRLPRRLGLAVSGGADSMALAYLCKELEKRGLVDDQSVTAFVVDHKAREESSREADMVAGWLADMGITTKIIELDWSINGPADTSASDKGKPTAFETHARRLRFQALGTACRDDRIETLMMGHHRDDTVETTLWRLCTGARGAGLAGIPEVTRIPECHGLYGVSESGSSYPLSKLTAETWDETGTEQESSSGAAAAYAQGGHLISTGGITLTRPLLSFPKSHLLATCHEHNIPFVNDPTNFDPTLTPRNAIRTLLASNRLPRALRPASILSLIRASRDLLEDSRDFSNMLLRRCTLHDFNLASGAAVIQFPPAEEAHFAISGKGKDPHQRNRQIQAMTLRRISELISAFPENHFPLRSFEQFTERVFPTSAAEPEISEKSQTKRQPFTLGGVMFQPLQSKSTTTTRDNPNDNAWLLSRQPFWRNRLPSHRFEVVLPPKPTSTSTSTPNPSLESEQLTYTPWSLWDNRYWFRIALSQKDSNVSVNEVDQNSKTTSIIIRSLQQSDLHHIRKHLLSSAVGGNGEKELKVPRGNHIWKQLTNTLARVAPNQSRFTIPALAVDYPNIEHGQLALALPTLDLRLPVSLPEDQWPWEIHWEWMYKMVDDETVKLMVSWKKNNKRTYGTNECKWDESGKAEKK